MFSTWLESFQIDKLWGSRDISKKIPEQVNIMHGANGTGKTTVINLIAGAINVDTTILSEIEFKKIRLTFIRKDKWAKPIIEVEKKYSERGENYFNYIVYEKSSEEGESFLVRHNQRRHHHPGDIYIEKSSNALMLESKLRSIVRMTWLNLERSVIPRIKYAADINKKIDDIKIKFLRYNTMLKRIEVELREEFQKSLFESLIATKRKDRFLNKVESLNVDKELDTLLEIYKHFNMRKEQGDRLIKQFKEAKVIVDNLRESSNISGFDDLIMIFDLYRAHTAVEEWDKQQSKIDILYKHKNTYLKVLNGLLHYKKIVESDEDLSVETDSGKVLSLSDLSSGEKQLFILLSEALLQRETHWVYIADEPELSLHIRWQEILIDSILKINPNAQILFATHSPDIISHYSEKTFDLEEALNASK